ncbi:MAG TPA: hypothetical protein IAA04_04990 [Candidatus Lachnoclostridium pullistercoris]|uniref:Uncharacterized protein n=1 Tax=Candidatus Lachnoclostridium pullistercoris TaxID=2838632 RepID=A0A9D2PEI6_9FIRM|nr:hypothetical protein [Candidatus Lachnoclostridium pullistercoris]
MHWYSHLYVGEKAAGKRYAVIQKIRRGEKDLRVYVITPASGGNNILDIYSAAEFFRPFRQERDPLILGIADGYDEALCVAGKIVADMYRTTGDFSLEKFLAQRDGERFE